MIRIVLAAILCCGAVLVASRASGETVVTAAQVNGTWKTKGGEFKIWRLGTKRLQVEFLASTNTRRRRTPMANQGDGSGIATIEGDTGMFKPEGREEECQITL